MKLRGMLTNTDCWALKPAFLSLLIVLVLGLICRLPGPVSFLLIPVTALGYLIAASLALATALYCVIKDRPRRGTSVLFVLVLPVLLWRPLNWVDDVAHLALTVDLGIGQLGSSSTSHDNSFVAYDWSVGLAGANTFLIRDATDEIALPLAKHTNPLSSENGLGEECAGKVQHLIIHYYVCNF